MYYQRLLDIQSDSRKKSLFLFSPRQTGKTTLLKTIFPKSPFYNLLLADVFLRISQRPQMIREELLAKSKSCVQPIIIDEIQKLPLLLDEVHALIEDRGFRFILTGSSPRKLKHGSANLLGGRAWTRHLFPLVSAEIADYDLLKILNFGALPPIYHSESPWDDLAAYVGNYLKEEIQAEALTRRIDNFSRFLQTASLANNELLNFESLANDAQVPPRTIIEYFKILEDTLVGSLLEPYTKTKKRKAFATAKFYFFDVGVCNFLAGRRDIKPRTDLFGRVLEHFIFTEIKAFLHYSRDTRPFCFWRSHSGFEVDFLIGDEVAIEVKAANLVHEKHLKGIKALSEELTLKKKVVVSLDSTPRRLENIDILPVKIFLQQLWSKEF